MTRQKKAFVWTTSRDAMLRRMLADGTPTAYIATTLGTTTANVVQRIQWLRREEIAPPPLPSPAPIPIHPGWLRDWSAR